jgi:hypothetical protein
MSGEHFLPPTRPEYFYSYSGPSLQNKAFATSLDVLEHISAIGKDWLARAHKSKKMI